MKDLKELRKKFEELGEEIKRLENLKKNKRWRAKLNNYYLYINNDGNIYLAEEKNYETDDYRYKARNYFETEEKARKYLEKIEIYYKLMDLAEELNGEEEIDWDNNGQNKYSIYFDCYKQELKQDVNWLAMMLGQIYCLNGDFLEIALERIGEDRLKKLFKEE